jgi:hypothetical protein
MKARLLSRVEAPLEFRRMSGVEKCEKELRVKLFPYSQVVFGCFCVNLRSW